MGLKQMPLFLFVIYSLESFVISSMHRSYLVYTNAYTHR